MTRCCLALFLGLFLFIAPSFCSGASAVATPSPASGSAVNSLTSITVSFTLSGTPQAVVNVFAENLLINDSPAQSVVQVDPSGTQWKFNFTQPAEGTVTVAWDPDNAISNQGGTSNGASFVPDAPWTYTLVDNTPPTMSAQNPPPGTTVNRLTQCEVYFSEPVQGVTAPSLLINGVPATSVFGAGSGPYTFTFSQPANGTVTFQWAAGQTITDDATIPNAFAGGSWAVTMNTAQPIANVFINEFLTQNVSLSTKVNPFVDEDGSFSPWIELYNSGSTSVNLAGWSLSDDALNPGEWFFPSGAQSIIPAGGYLVIWADGKDRKNPTGSNKMHTNFTLKQSGEYLGLFSAELPRLVVPLSNFSASYPPQRGDVSYGYDQGNNLGYLTTPTPGAANAITGVTAITADVNFSVQHGYFAGPFNLVLSTSTPGAAIRYTTDGSVPTAGNGTVYSRPLGHQRNDESSRGGVWVKHALIECFDADVSLYFERCRATVKPTWLSDPISAESGK